MEEDPVEDVHEQPGLWTHPSDLPVVVTGLVERVPHVTQRVSDPVTYPLSLSDS